MSIEKHDVLNWLDTWQELINGGQYEAARPLFSDHVVAFGTVAGAMRGLPELESRQWRQVWYRIKKFTFQKETAAIWSDPRSQFATVCCLWHSLGKAKSAWYERRGRVTLVLSNQTGSLRCVHSHFSMEPGIPAVVDID
jgi:ketosteroid isomerase-like protein